MSKSNPSNLSDAIRRLEKATSGHDRSNGDGKSSLGDDIENIKGALDDLKPHLNKLKRDLSEAASETFENTLNHVRETIDKGQKSAKDMGKKVDDQLHENPWMALGIIGVVAFLIGFLLGRKD